MFKKAWILGMVILASSVYAQDGVYKGTAKGGKRGDISVDVTLKGGKIADIVVTKCKENYTYAIDQIKEAIVKSNNINVDIVSGASMTSKTYLAAIEEALKPTGKNFKGKMIKPAAKK